MEILVHKDRGPVLLAVRIHSVVWTLLLWAVVVAWVGAVVAVSLRRHSLGAVGEALPNLAGLVALLFGYLLYPRIKFYDSGVEIPPTRDDNRARYLRWDQIERSSWDGDRLVLTGTSSVLAGGPVQGGAVRIPRSQQLAVAQILETKFAAR
jgi:hypothetical protein